MSSQHDLFPEFCISIEHDLVYQYAKFHKKVMLRTKVIGPQS
jgi:hypothetical protein